MFSQAMLRSQVLFHSSSISFKFYFSPVLIDSTKPSFDHCSLISLKVIKMESIPDSHDLLHFCISYEYHEYMETFKSLGVFTFLDFAKFKINFMFPDFTLTSGKVPRQSEKNGFVSLMNLFLEKSDNRQKSNIETNFVFYKKISCVTIGKFDALSFEFDFDHWNPSPAVFLNDLQFKASDKINESIPVQHRQ